MRRIKLPFAGLAVYFIDRELALKRVFDWAEKGTYPVQVVFGPEGCGKTAWLRQSAELLKDMGFDVIYFNPIERDVFVELGFHDLKRDFMRLVEELSKQHMAANIAWNIIDFARRAVEHGSKRIAILVDDVFQDIGISKSAIYVKGLLGLLEHPPREYERIVAVVATSEGASRREIGKHDWADLIPMWNMGRGGFEQLYNLLPDPKPEFEYIWRVTGGNPRYLEQLYKANWIADKIVERIVERKNVTPGFVARWREWLEKAVEDPDVLWEPGIPQELVDELIEKNLIVYFLSKRDPWFWVDIPPPEKDLELGIGRYVAWQTPLHREAIRRVLKMYN